MVLRIKGTPAAEVTPVPEDMPVVPEDVSPEVVPEDIEEIPDIPSPLQEGKASIVAANYRTPDLGPFLCANCQYFDGDETCLIVSGIFDPEGVCNLFTSSDLPTGDPLSYPDEEPLVDETLGETPLFATEGQLATPVPEELL